MSKNTVIVFKNLKHLKRFADKRQKQTELDYAACLDQASRQGGFRDYHEAKIALEKASPVPTPNAPENKDDFSLRWARMKEKITFETFPNPRNFAGYPSGPLNCHGIVFRSHFERSAFQYAFIRKPGGQPTLTLWWGESRGGRNLKAIILTDEQMKQFVLAVKGALLEESNLLYKSVKLIDFSDHEVEDYNTDRYRCPKSLAYHDGNFIFCNPEANPFDAPYTPISIDEALAICILLNHSTQSLS